MGGVAVVVFLVVASMASASLSAPLRLSAISAAPLSSHPMSPEISPVSTPPPALSPDAYPQLPSPASGGSPTSSGGTPTIPSSLSPPANPDAIGNPQLDDLAGSRTSPPAKLSSGAVKSVGFSYFSRWAFCGIALLFGDELLESGMANALVVSADQRNRLITTTDRLNHSTERIKESRRTMLETEELGVSILQDLNQQRQSLLHAHNTLHGVDDNIGKSRKILTAMSRRMDKNKWIIGTIIAVLVIAILLVLYFKLIH